LTIVSGTAQRGTVLLGLTLRFLAASRLLLETGRVHRSPCCLGACIRTVGLPEAATSSAWCSRAAPVRSAGAVGAAGCRGGGT
jgi:hypothetical protein